MYSFRDHSCDSISSVEFDKSTPSNPSKLPSELSLTVQIYARVRQWLGELGIELRTYIPNPTFVVLITQQSCELILKD